MAKSNPLARASAKCQEKFGTKEGGTGLENCPLGDESPPDVVIPIVFPDYLITVDDLPWYTRSAIRLYPGVSIESEVESKKGVRYKVKGLGHAGVMFIKGRSGAVQYWEYGRYDPPERGWVRSKPMPSVKMGSNKKPTKKSLAASLAEVASVGGHDTRIKAVYIEVETKFGAMLAYAQKREKENSVPNRKPYNLNNNNCFTFAMQVTQVAGVDVSTADDLFPSSNMDNLRVVYPPLDYYPAMKNLETKVQLQ